MIDVYGSSLCPNCKPLVFNLKKYNLSFIFHDISKSSFKRVFTY